MEKKVARLKQLGLVVGSLAWASPIRLSGRGMESPAARRRSLAAYQRDASDPSTSRLAQLGASLRAAQAPTLGVRDTCTYIRIVV